MKLKVCIIITAILPFILTAPHEITQSNFKQLFGVDYGYFHSSTNINQRQWIVMFHTPWCGFCKRTKPVFQDFANMLVTEQIEDATQSGQDVDAQIAKAVQTGMINCETEQNICQYFNIRGYPTIYYLTADKKAVSYNGPRTTEGLFDFLDAHDPEKDKNCQWGFVNHGLFDLVIQAFMLYWQYIIGFGVILPMFVGYFLAEYLNRRDENKMKAQKEAMMKKQQKKEEKKEQSKDEKKEEGQQRKHDKND